MSDRTGAINPLADQIVAFWFGPALSSPAAAQARSKVWFGYDPEFDATIARRFGDLPARALAGEFDAWSGEPRSALAGIIVLDQFPRNLYRASAAAFACDARALAAAMAAVDAGWDERVHPLQAVFLYLPFEHAEDMSAQERAVALFDALATRAPAGTEPLFAGFADYAHRHRDVIARFGRFPYRNAWLGRASTAAEIAYLEGGGERFGPSSR